MLKVFGSGTQIYNVCKLLLWQCIDFEIFFVQDNDIETLVEELCHKLKNLEQHDGKTSFQWFKKKNNMLISH